MSPGKAFSRAALCLYALTAGVACAGLARAADAPAAPSFQQILAAPDDLALNLSFAESEAREGRLLSASAALERILLQAPGWSQARLLYAAVLYRLDDMAGAQQQLAQLDQSKLSDLQKAEAKRYGQMIANRRSPFTYNGEVSLGGSYQGDALGGFGLQFTGVGTVHHKDGGAGVIDSHVGGLFKLNPAGNIQAYGNLAFFDSTASSGLNNEFVREEVTGGVLVENPLTAVRIGAVARSYRIANDRYMDEVGAQAAWTWRKSDVTGLFGSAEYVRQSYYEPFIDTLTPVHGRAHDGGDYDLTVGLRERLNARETLTGQVGVSLKQAEYGGFAYVSPHLQAGYDRLFNKGAYVSLLGQAAQDQYDHPDPILGVGVTRRDDRYRLRAAVGAPLSAFTKTGATGDQREGVILEGALTYDARKSRAPIANFSSAGAEVRLIYRFGSRTGS